MTLRMLISISALILAGLGIILYVCILAFKWKPEKKARITIIYVVLVLLWGLYSVILI